MSVKKSSGCLKTLFIGFISILILAIIFIVFALSGVVTKVANDQLPKQLGTEATLGNSNINLLGGNMVLSELTIQQPEGFADLGESLLTLEKFEVHAPLGKAIGQDPIVVKKARLSGLDLNLIVDSNLVFNISKLGPTPVEEPEPEIVEDPETEPAAVPPVWVKHVLLEKINIAFQDYERDWGIDLSDIEFELKDLQIGESQMEGPGTVEGHVYFHSEKASGRLKLHAKVGVISPEKPESVPAVQMAMGLIGFDLDLVEPFLVPSPAVAKAAFGGSGFDFLLFMEITPGDAPAEQEISGIFHLITDKGQKTNDKLGGTLAEPKLPFTTLFADILGNQFGRIAGVGTNVAQGGLEAGKAVGKTGVAAAKGVGKTVGGFAGGVFRTAKGVVTLDKDEALGGMSDATVGTVKNAAGTVADTAGTAGSGVMDTAGTVTGGDDVAAWWANVEARQDAFDEEAKAWFEANPFPTANVSEE